MSINLNGCLVTVEGNYFANSGSVDRKKVKKPYKITVRVAAPEGALSVIKGKLLDRCLTKLYPDYHTYHTHEITGLTDLQGQPLLGYNNVKIMNFNEIANYVTVNKLPLKLELYTELDTLRTMVFLAEINIKLFTIRQAVIEKEAREDAVLAALNPELFDTKHPIKVPEVTAIPNIEPAKKVQDQKVQQTWDERQKKYIPVDEFVEDFDRKGEEPYGQNVDEEGVGVLHQNPPVIEGVHTEGVTFGTHKPVEIKPAHQGNSYTKSLMDEL